MKTKTPNQPQTAKFSKTHREMHAFIKHILLYLDEPTAWPLTREEQAAFVRTVLHQARKIQNTEEFMKEGVLLSAEDLAMAS